MSFVQPISSDWQSNGSLSDSLWYMMEQQIMCDVIFEVGKEYERIGAHSSVLAARSCVFFKQFATNLPEQKEIELEETNPRHFRLFLKYMYMGQVNISESDNEAVLAIAEKYKVTRLTQLIIADTLESMTSEKFCTFVKNFDTFSDYLKGKSLDFVFQNPIPVFNSPDFVILPYSFLLELLKNEYLVLDEETLCTSLLLWATKACENNKMEVNGENQRTVLRDILKFIRFSLVRQDFFTENISEKGLLTPTEEVQLLKFFLTKKAPADVSWGEPRKAPTEPFSIDSHNQNPPSLFFTSMSGSLSYKNDTNQGGASNNVSRQTSIDKSNIGIPSTASPSSMSGNEITRFKFEGQGWGYRNNKRDAVAFSSSNDIRLESILVYGSSRPNSMVEVKVLIRHNDHDIYSTKTELKCIPSEKVYEIKLVNQSSTDGVVVKAGEMYHIIIALNADSGFYGKGGASSCTNGNITINFMRSKFSTNNTTESIGQIPGFKFALN